VGILLLKAIEKRLPAAGAKTISGAVLASTFRALVQERAAAHTKIGIGLIGSMTGRTGVNGRSWSAFDTAGPLRGLRGNISNRGGMYSLIERQSQVIGPLITQSRLFLKGCQNYPAHRRG